MNVDRAPSLSEIIRGRQQEAFVGREDQITAFRQNLTYSPQDEQRRFVYAISGQGGVGKTWLMRRFQEIAQASGGITSWTDESQDDLPSTMGAIASQLGHQGLDLGDFNERYSTYRQLRSEIESDPNAPQGLANLLGRTFGLAGLGIMRRAPIIGGALDPVNDEAVAQQFGSWTDYLVRKLGNQDEVLLVGEPVNVLTPLLLTGLQGAEEDEVIVLHFDTYERTYSHLDGWIQDLLEERHGLVPTNIVFVLAGQDELSRNRWSPYEGILVRMLLEPFTVEEARDYLIRKGVTDESTIRVIMQLSGRLPLLTATLAEQSPTSPEQVGDPSGTAVSRFLRWVEDTGKRQLALDAALPLRLNQDVLNVIAADGATTEEFEWLITRPFTTSRSDGWAYHEVVRSQMLRYKQNESPASWRDLHRRLADYFEGVQVASVNPALPWGDRTWRDLTLNRLYHRVCQSPGHHVQEAIGNFLLAFGVRPRLALRLAEFMEQAGRDLADAQVESIASHLRAGLDAYAENQYDSVAAMFTWLLESPWLDEGARITVLEWRALLYGQAGNHSGALIDLTRLVELEPDSPEHWISRARIHRLLQHYDEALEDLERARSLESELPSFFLQRALVRLATGQREKAEGDIERYRSLFNPTDRHPELYRVSHRELVELPHIRCMEPRVEWDHRVSFRLRRLSVPCSLATRSQRGHSSDA